jgi:hypothetical protein
MQKHNTLIFSPQLFHVIPNITLIQISDTAF